MHDVDGLQEQLIVKYVGENKPAYQTPGSAGADVFSAIDMTIFPGKSAVVPTGLKIQLPVDYECQVRSRSGLASKHNVFVLNSPGTCDSDYRDEIGVILMNLGDSPFILRKGDRVAQLVFSRISRAVFEKVSVLSETDRKGGFGSTGV